MVRRERLTVETRCQGGWWNWVVGEGLGGKWRAC